MRMELEQKQTMKMVMTQELQQAIGLLQMSTYELSRFIREQAEENPFIEFVDEDREDTTGFQQAASNHPSSPSHPLETVSTKSESMHDRLLEQLLMLKLSEKQEKKLRYLILNIDEQGYLRLSNTEIAAAFSISELNARELRQELRFLEPCGIGAEDLSECLEWQALRLYPEDDVLHHVIKEYLPALANKQWDSIMKACGITLEKVKESFEKIRTLNPRPTSIFATETDYVTPDLSVEWNEEKSNYTVLLHDHYIPKLTFNHSYASTLPNSKDTSSFVTSRLRQFEWLQQSIMKRRDTIMKIMNTLLKHQRAFFSEGFKALKPLTMKDIAVEIDMHESTVSRATANKIIETPVGIFDMRQFFSSKLQTDDGEGASQMTVKEMIRELIQNEDKLKPLSDQKIVNMLREQSVAISRRTVAKYRESMQILSSSKRKAVIS